MPDAAIAAHNAEPVSHFVRQAYRDGVRPTITEPPSGATVLVISPHPDDAELAMGGNMKAWVKAGVQVVHLVLIGGIYETAYGTIVLAGARLEDAIAAADALGTHLLMYEGVPENKGISHVGEIVKELDYWIKNLQPSEVYTCLPWFNQDHEAVHKATLAAMRRHFSCRFWAYEMPQQGLGYQMPEFGWEYVRMSPESRTAKAAAIHAYEPTQKLFSKDGPISWKGADALARMRGSEVGVDYAERFLLLRGS